MVLLAGLPPWDIGSQWLPKGQDSVLQAFQPIAGSKVPER